MLKSLMIAAALIVSTSAMQTEPVHDHVSHTAAEAVKTVNATGVIKGIKKEQNTVQIFHDPIPQLRWPAMNMSFNISDSAIFDGIAVGDRVRFEFTRNGTKNSIVKISR